MSTQPVVQKQIRIREVRQNLRRQICAAVLLGSLTLAAPVIASAAPTPHKEVRVPRLDRRAIENLQRWVSGGHDTWCKDAGLVASAELRRIAPEFDGYQFDQVSLPLEAKSRAAGRAVYSYHSLDGRTAYRITLRRFSWLMPIAGDASSIVWVPARVEILTR